HLVCINPYDPINYNIHLVKNYSGYFDKQQQQKNIENDKEENRNKNDIGKTSGGQGIAGGSKSTITITKNNEKDKDLEETTRLCSIYDEEAELNSLPSQFKKELQHIFDAVHQQDFHVIKNEHLKQYDSNLKLNYLLKNVLPTCNLSRHKVQSTEKIILDKNIQQSTANSERRMEIVKKMELDLMEELRKQVNSQQLSKGEKTDTLIALIARNKC
ncbi:unnamed protein product, partial [Didymodactylos carnosus]